MAAPNKEHRRNKALGQQRQRHAGPHPVNDERPAAFERSDQRVKRDQQKKRQNRLRNNEARKQKRPDRRQHAQSGIEPRALAPRPPRPQPREPRERQHGQRVGQVRGKGVLAKNPVHAGHEPIRQRRLLNVADAVDLRRNQVAALGHVLRGLRVRRVHVVQQRRRKQRRKIHRDKNGRKQQPHRARRGRQPHRALDGLCTDLRFCIHRDFCYLNQNISRTCAAFRALTQNQSRCTPEPQPLSRCDQQGAATFEKPQQGTPTLVLP